MRLRKDSAEMQDQDILLLATISEALAHPARIKIFRFVMQCNKKHEPVCNGDIVNEFNLSQATISQHVKKLVNAGLLETKRVDRFTYYYVHLGTLQNYVNATKKFENMPE